MNVYPAEIEGLLISHDKVADVAVFGIPHPEFGEEVMAVVQPLDWGDANDDTEAELIDWMRERLSSVKVPRKVDFLEQLPVWTTASSINDICRTPIATRCDFLNCQAVMKPDEPLCCDLRIDA